MNKESFLNPEIEDHQPGTDPFREKPKEKPTVVPLPNFPPKPDRTTPTPKKPQPKPEKVPA